jgi:hypothetical protein
MAEAAGSPALDMRHTIAVNLNCIVWEDPCWHRAHFSGIPCTTIPSEDLIAHPGRRCYLPAAPTIGAPGVTQTGVVPLAANTSVPFFVWGLLR